MDDKGNITISGKAIAISGTESAGMVAAPTPPEGQDVDGSGISLTPSEANLIGKDKTTVGAGQEATLSGATVNVVANGETNVQGSKVNIN
jgi:tRNA-binding EMAP/Myf-like protein